MAGPKVKTFAPKHVHRHEGVDAASPTFAGYGSKRVTDAQRKKFAGRAMTRHAPGYTVPKGRRKRRHR